MRALKESLAAARGANLMMNLRTRSALLRRAASFDLEQLGMIANDALTDLYLTRLCRSDGGFLDVGAHIGSVLSRVHGTYPKARIFAIEADADKARNLERRYPWARIFNCAVGEEEGTATFWLDAEKPGYSSLIEAEGRTAQEVKIRPIDALLPEADIDLVKIDIEGAELGALRGARKLVERARPTFIFESVRPERNALGYAPGDIWDWCESSGYALLTPDRLAHTAPEMTRETFVDCHYYPRRSHNYVAVARTRRDEIRIRARTILGAHA